MPAVVLDVEADRRHRQPQQDRGGNGQIPGLHHEHQQHVGAGEPGQNQPSFQVHTRAIAAFAARAFEVLLDPLTEHLIKVVARAELQFFRGRPLPQVRDSAVRCWESGLLPSTFRHLSDSESRVLVVSRGIKSADNNELAIDDRQIGHRG